MAESHREFFKNYCVACHNQEKQKGHLRLDNISFSLNTLPNADTWQKILNYVNKGDMPPEGSKQPAAPEKAAFLEALTIQLVNARKLLSDQYGRIAMRRLNRREYRNTIRDLLGVELDVKDLPNDSGSGSFDTVGASLFFSNDQFERYLELGRNALDQAVASGAKPERKKVRRETEIEANKDVRNQLNRELASFRRAKQWKASNGKPAKDFGFVDDGDAKFKMSEYETYGATLGQYLVLPGAETGSYLCIFRPRPFEFIEIPKDAPPGKYVLRIRAGHSEHTPQNRSFMELRLKDAPDNRDASLISTHHITGTIKNPQVLEAAVRIGNDGLRRFLLQEKRHNTEAAERALFYDHRNMTGVAPDPAIWIDWVEWEGPINDDWPSAAHKHIFFKGDSLASEDDAYAREIIERFAIRAFREKAPEPPFIDRLLRLYQSRRKAGDDFHESIKAALAVVLASPSFLYLSEISHESKPKDISDREFAVRLSYFLWSAPPDEELFELARNGELRKPAVLYSQVERMLNDPRSWEFVRGFTHQWLDMERLNFFRFNFKLYPGFDDSTKIHAGEEAYHTIDTLMRENLGLGQLIKTDFVVINGLLANYYGIDGISGDAYRKIKLPPDSPRGGLFGMAAILAMGSNGETTSPVERGVFVLRKILHDPPPPAPAGVPQLNRVAQNLSTRERLAMHQEQPQCAHCHRKIDPIGFGLENFNAAGLWRTTEQYKKGKIDKDWEIEPAGTLPDGTAFKDYFEMRDRIARRSENLARGFTEALIEYGLGRPYGFSDDELANEILNNCRAHDFKIRSFFHALVQSKAFGRK